MINFENSNKIFKGKTVGSVLQGLGSASTEHCNFLIVFLNLIKSDKEGYYALRIRSQSESPSMAVI